MERIKQRPQSLVTQMVLVNLSANETNGACVFPSRPQPACWPNRPDTYLRLLLPCKIPLAISSQSIHWVRSGHTRKLSICQLWAKTRHFMYIDGGW